MVEADYILVLDLHVNCVEKYGHVVVDCCDRFDEAFTQLNPS